MIHRNISHFLTNGSISQEFTMNSEGNSDIERALPPSVVFDVDSVNVPAANYNPISDKLRRSTPHYIQCAMFCGGKKCKYEFSKGLTEQNTAIKGIFSHWITNNLLAMARPNTACIVKHNLIQSFKEKNIRTLINLQERGEHANCGNGLALSGFSYEPQTFMENDIFYYNFQWKDYSIVHENHLLDMVKVISFALTEGKVAVHCHAGLGRTGVLIACYLIYSMRCHPFDAIKFVRSQRPNSIQTRGQIAIIFQFAQLVLPYFIVYPNTIRIKDNCQHGLSLKKQIQRQNKLIHGYEWRQLRHIPKIVFIICEKLLRMCKQRQQLEQHRQNGGFFSFSRFFSSSPSSVASIDFKSESTSGFISPETIFTDMTTNSGDSRSLTAESNTSSLIKSDGGGEKNGQMARINSFESNLIYQPYINTMPTVEESKDDIETNLFDLNLYKNPFAHIALTQLGTVSRSSLEDFAFEKSFNDYEFLNSFKGSNEASKNDNFIAALNAILKPKSATEITGEKIDNDDKSLNDDNGRSESSDSGTIKIRENLIGYDFFGDMIQYRNDYDNPTGEASQSSQNGQFDYDLVDSETIIDAVLNDFRIDDELDEQLEAYQVNLNSQQSAWNQLWKETNPKLLSALLWSWFENLSDPIFNERALTYIILKAEKPIDALHKLDQETRYTFEYLIRFIAELDPQKEILLDKLLMRLTAELMRQKIRKPDDQSVPEGVEWPQIRRNTKNRVLSFVKCFYRIVKMSQRQETGIS